MNLIAEERNPSELIRPLALDTYRLYNQMAYYQTEMFVYAHSDLTATNPLGINSRRRTWQNSL